MTAPRITTPPEAWRWLVAVMRIHRSQFPENTIEAVASVPIGDRVITFVPAQSRPILDPSNLCN